MDRERTLKSLYICYQTLDDPLVHSQVVAYLEGLAALGHQIHLITFEPRLDPERRRALQEDLANRGIGWQGLTYHKRLSLPATIFDTLVGAAVAARLVRRLGLDAVHARSHVPAAAALIVKRLTGCKLIFDMRGLMAEEYADAGRWRRGGIPFRITKWVESRAITRADAMVVLTKKVRDFLFATRKSPPLEVIPCCADLTRIESLHAQREAARAELGVGARPVVVYVGKFGGWYLEREMVDFFATAREQQADLLMLVITQADRSPVVAALESRGIGADDYRVMRAMPDEIGRYLAAADYGISFIRPCLSKISSSPTKVGEYLAAGLPVVSGPRIGDLDRVLAGGSIGTVVSEFSAPAYRDAAARVRALLDDPATAKRCNAVAHDEFSLQDVGIPRYDRLYRLLAS